MFKNFIEKSKVYPDEPLLCGVVYYKPDIGTVINEDIYGHKHIYT